MSVPQNLSVTTPPTTSGAKAHWEDRHTPPVDDPENEAAQQPDSKDTEDGISPIQRRQTRDFATQGDEDELGKLVGDEGEKLLAVADEIRNIDALRHVDLALPQLVVVGDTSSGKSSLLQALTKLPFPVSSGLCTRFVTDTTIHRCSPSENPGYTIEVKMDESSSSGKPPFPRKEVNGKEWSDIQRSLRKDIADAYDQMSPENFTQNKISESADRPKGRTRRTSGQNFARPQLLKHKLVIDVRKPKEAHFRIVDVPGLMKGGVSEDDKLSEDLTLEYIRDEGSIVLAVIQSNSDINNQKAIRLAQDNGALDRTIGVITKCDRIEARDEERVFDLLRNMRDSRLFLKLGWFAVRNRNSAEVNEEDTFAKRDMKEAELFSGGIWKDATMSNSVFHKPKIDSNILGIECLRNSLKSCLNRKIKDEFPVLMKRMKDMKTQTEDQLDRMGVARDNPQLQRRFLTDLQIEYQREATRSLEGDYRHCSEDHASKLRYHVSGFNDLFATDMLNNGVEYAWVTEAEFRTPPSHSTQAAPTPSVYDWIYRAWITSTGSEPKHTAPQHIRRRLYQDQIISWELKANAYLSKVEKAIHSCNEDLFEVTCKDEGLRKKIRNKLETQQEESLAKAKSELDSLLRDNKAVPNPYNPAFDTKYASLQNYRITLQAEMKDANPRVSANPEPETEKVEWERFFWNNKKVFEIHDWLWSYWLWACPRFVDNVIIQVVERHLLGSNGPLRLFNLDWIFSLSDEDLEYLASEDEATKSERRRLKEKLEGLSDALNKTDKVSR